MAEAVLAHWFDSIQHGSDCQNECLAVFTSCRCHIDTSVGAEGFSRTNVDATSSGRCDLRLNYFASPVFNLLTLISSSSHTHLLLNSLFHMFFELLTSLEYFCTSGLSIGGSLKSQCFCRKNFDRVY